jgi:hypothetical protein
LTNINKRYRIIHLRQDSREEGSENPTAPAAVTGFQKAKKMAFEKQSLMKQPLSHMLWDGKVFKDPGSRKTY